MLPLAHRSSAILFVCVAFLLAWGPFAAADWPTGVGGSSARYGQVDTHGPTGPDLLWEGSRPAIVSQQGACQGDLFVTSRIQSFTIPTGTWVVAHELETGDELWAIQLPYNFPDVSWRSRAMAIHDGHVYASRSGGEINEDYLYALDPADGSIVWQSEDVISERTTESPAFAANGDLIIGNFYSLMRIDRSSGATVWDVPRSTPSSNGAQATVFGSRAYVWEPSPYGPVVTAFDLEHGERLFSSDPISGGLVQQVGLLCGPDGTIYAPRTQNNPATDFFVALEDVGDAFVERWRVAMGYTPFASFAVGPDGTVYTYSRDLEILRLDPASGLEIDRSDPIPYDYPAEPRMAIDGDGRVYVTNGGFGGGALLVYTADLQPLWSEPINGNNLGGPVLADDGTLIVCGTGTLVRAYRSPTADVAMDTDPAALRLLAPASPNPFGGRTELRFAVEEPAAVSLRILDAQGRLVRTLLASGQCAPGTLQLVWDGRDGQGVAMPSGLYLATLQVGARCEVRKMLLSR